MYEVTCLDNNQEIVTSLNQWDSNITLYINGLDDVPITPKCHFCNKNSKTALVVDTTSTANGFAVKIPNVLLEEPYSITMYIYVMDSRYESGRTMYIVKLPVKPRPKPDTYIFVDNVDYIDAYVINARIKELFKAITDNPNYTGAMELIDIRTAYDGTTYDTAGEAVRSLGAEIEAIKKELMDYIDKKAVDGLAYEENMLWLTSDGEQVGDPVEIVGGSGGGGGGGTSSVVRITNNNGTSTIATASGQPVLLKFTFTSLENDEPTGDCTCSIMVNGLTKTTYPIHQGYNEKDVSEYLVAGTNSVRITCTDQYGVYKRLTYYISVVDLSLSSTFDDSMTFTEDILFKYTPMGAIEKTIHFIIDNNEIGTSTITASGKQTTRILPFMSHGVHTLEVYATAVLEGQEMESNHLVYDIMCVEDGNVSPMISSAYGVKNVKQGEQINIPYTVYDPTKLGSDIVLQIYTMENGTKKVYSETGITVGREKQYWNTRRYPIGTVNFAIIYGDISKTHTIEVAENIIDVEPATNDLDAYLTSAGRSNKEANPAVWTDKDVTTTFNSFNWSSNGWIEDNNNEVALRLNGDANIKINEKPFDSDLRVYGKTIEMEFAIRDVNNRDAKVISCMSNGIGFEVTADRATLKSEQTTVECFFGDEEKIRLAFVIESRNEYRMLSIYLNGVRSVVKRYPDNDNFQQSSPVPISVGSKLCSVDLYSFRSYSTALTDNEIRDNYISDIQDIVRKQELNEDNKVYDDFNNISYEKIKDKIPVMIIVGDLPKSKGDKKKVTVKYEDCFQPNFNFVDTCTIDVQGTSSQYFVIKNYKQKYPNAHQNAPDQMAIKVFTMKADYAEATSTHNTGNANFVHTLYSDKTPAQEDDPLCRTSVYGFPCVIFHQANEGADLKFVGKYNFNADKGAENLYGFTSNYEVECWELLSNTTEECLFQKSIDPNETYYDEDKKKDRPVWAKSFEARYPDIGDDADVTHLKEFMDWVVSTKDNVQKFKSEFEQHCNLHKFLVYYVYTSLMLMVDQRAKNMMLTYWGKTGKFEPWFYDNDTCLGINNEGQLVFDYFHEDIDRIGNANVYNGQNSLLWINFRQAFADEIKATYQDLRNNNKITYEKLYDTFYTNLSNKWCISVYNQDSDYKYISMLRSENDASNLDQVRGTGEEHFKYFMKNRIKYFDSKWYARDYADDYISFRIYTPVDENNVPITDLAVPANANITLTTFSDMYAGVKYRANGVLQQKRMKKNETYTFVAPNEVWNDTETGVYGASELSSLGDLSPLYCGSINVSKATKLTELIIGSGVSGYSNVNLKSLSVGTNKLLKKIDIQNCPNLTDALALANCPNIEEIYAKGSGITSVELGSSGFLRKVQLPATITNLTLQNQLYIQELTLEGYDSIKTLWIDNCPTVDGLDILKKCQNLEYLRLTGIDWTFDDATFLKSLYTIGGKDESGNNSEYPFLVGKVHLKDVTGSELADLKKHYPYITFTYDILTSTVYFMSEDGTTQYSTSTSKNGADVTYTGATPTKTSTAQYTYTHAGWAFSKNKETVDADALKNVEGDRIVYAVFSKTIRSYPIVFKNSGGTQLQNTNVNYGDIPSYKGSAPKKDDVPSGKLQEDYEFSGWSPEIVSVTGSATYVATYVYTGYIEDDWDTIVDNIKNGTYKSKYSIGSLKLVTITYDDGSTEDIEMEIADFDHDDLNNGDKAGITFISKQLLKNVVKYNTNRKSLNNNSGYSVGGWKLSDLRNDLIKLVDNLPSLLINNLCSVVKKSDGGYKTDNVITTNDKLWIPSLEEVGLNSSSNYIQGQGTQYPIFSDDASRKKGKEWALRSTYVSSNDFGWYIKTSGSKDYNSNNYNRYIPLCFSINPPIQYEIEDSWDDIFESIDNGTYHKYDIGSYKPLDLGDEGVINMQIVAMDADELADGSGYAPLTFLGMELLSNTRIFGSKPYWSINTELRGYLNDTLLSTIQSNVKKRIQAVKKYTRESKNVETLSIDKLWIPSEKEVVGVKNGIGYNENNAQFYRSLFTDNESRKKSCYGKNNATDWFLRTYCGSKGVYNYVAGINSTGVPFAGTSSRIYSTDYPRGICLGFCLGLYQGTIDDSWEEINTNITNGTYKKKYSVGDTKAMQLTTGEYVLMQIAGFDHHDKADGSGKAGISWISVNTLKTNYAFNLTQKTYSGNTSWNSGGWGLSDIRVILNNDIFATIPNNVKTHIKEVSIQSDSGRIDNAIKTTNDNLWLPCCEEIGFDTIGYIAGQGTKFELFNSNNDRKKQKINESNYSSYWLRSSYTDNDRFCYIEPDGVGRYGNYSNRLMDIPLCFDM